MAKFENLGELLNCGGEEDGDLASINLLFLDEVADSDMACGGRRARDRRLRERGQRSEEKSVLAPLNCGTCAVGSSCLIGIDRQ